MKKQLILYTRNRCPLCEKAKDVLIQLQIEISFELIELDIEQKDEWVEQYGLMIPVVSFAGEVIQYGQISKEVIKKHLLEHTMK